MTHRTSDMSKKIWKEDEIRIKSSSNTTNIPMEPQHIFVTILCIIGILMHMTALFLLTKSTGRILQREYFLALSCVDIWMCISTSLETVTKVKERSIFFNIFSIISITGIALYQCLLLTFITIDRFVSIYMPLRYQILPIKRYTTVLIIFNACASLSVVVTFLSLYFYFEKDYFRIVALAATCIWLPFDMLVLITSIAVYGYFAAVRSKLKQSNAWRQLIVSTRILLSFILFYLIPDLIFVLAAPIPEELYDVFNIMYILNMICDALTVTFLNRELRRKLIRTMCCSNEIIPE